MVNERLERGLQYAASGWEIFPCKGDKSPMTKNGFKDASRDPEKIKAWWTRSPNALIGLYCKGSGILAIDIDNKHGKHGTQSWGELVKSYGNGGGVIVGPMQSTQNGGVHLLFRHPDFDVTSKTDALGDGIDLRSQAYVIVAPSPGYNWLDDHGPEQPLTDLPEWLRDRILSLAHTSDSAESEVESDNQNFNSTGEKWLTEALSRAKNGDRNATGAWLAQQLRDDRIPQSEAERILQDYTHQVPALDHPYTIKEALASVKSAYMSAPRETAKAVRQNPVSGEGVRMGASPPLDSSNNSAPHAAGEVEPVTSPHGAVWQPGSHLTDSANAERLARQHREKLRHVYEWGWMCWDGKRWARDKEDLAISAAVQTARSIYQEAAIAAEMGDDQGASDLAKFAKSSLNRYRLGAMLSLAQSELPARPELFDRDDYLFNTKNNVVDLRTGGITAHDPAHMITKIAGTHYDPNATCPTWLAFLDKVLAGDAELIEYLQRAAGYTLTGSVIEQCLFFLFGSGSNGKSTYIQALLSLMGEYGQQAAPSLMMAGNRHPTEIADLQGSRFVATVEVEEGRRMAEVLTKQLTGGDRIKARYMRRDFFEFDPTFKLWLSANHEPVIRGTDNAIWRRIRKIPFEVTIPEDEQDQHMLEKLLQELPGILNWAITGALMWAESGLKTPNKVKMATLTWICLRDSLMSAASWAMNTRRKRNHFMRLFSSSTVRTHGHQPLLGARCGSAGSRKSGNPMDITTRESGCSIQLMMQTRTFKENEQ
jgi:P4 family phage/plasmid primase-like protien